MARAAVTRETRIPDLDFVQELAQQLRVDGIRMSTAAGSGHPTSSMSAADLMAVLMARHLRYDFQDPQRATNDHLIFSKGHASPLLYAMFRAAGAISEEEMFTYRKLGSRLQGHPTPAIPWVDVATGSLGQGLPIAVGIALAGRKLDRLPYHVWVLCGDSEVSDGERMVAAIKGVKGKQPVIPLGLGGRLMPVIPRHTERFRDLYRRREEAFGCDALVVDGHDLHAIDEAFSRVREASERPTVVIARTIKGKGFSELENKDGWHGKALPKDMADRAIAELGGVRTLRVEVAPPQPGSPAIQEDGTSVSLPRYEKGAKVATRKAYGDALVALGARATVVALDGEVSNSTHADQFKQAYPERFFEMFIAEQQLVAAAVGLSVRRYVPFASTFAAFFSRAYDFIRMAAISRANLRLSGSHAGVEIGEDGPSQMALEDLAAMRAVQGSTVLYPCDATSTAQLVQAMAGAEGIVYLRTTRGAYPVLYGEGDSFPIGGSRVIRQGQADRVAIIAAGVTVHNAIEAAAQLDREGIAVRVLDCYSVKPIDRQALREAARATGGRLVVVEDHYPEGGLGAAVMEALAAEPDPPRVVHLAVQGLPGSGKPAELMDAAGISARHIAAAVRKLKD